MIPNEMMTNVNMLHLVVLHGVVSDLDCTFIVTQKRHFVKHDTDGAKLTREIILLRSPATAPEKRLLLGDGTRKVLWRIVVVEQTSLCVVLDQPVGNPKRKV
jgi:hypothetical protein